MLVFSALLAAIETVGLLLSWQVLKGVAACPTNSAGNGCVLGHDVAISLARWQLEAVAVLPVLIGAFLAAPMIPREYEQGTAVIAWTQDLSMRRWLVVKICALAAYFSALLLVVSIAAHPVSSQLARLAPSPQLSGTFQRLLFETGFPLNVAYGLFALAFGVLVGSLIRKVLPSVGIALVLVVAVREVVSRFLRAHYIPPLHKVTAADTPAEVGKNSLVLTENAWSTPSGHVRAVPQDCLSSRHFDQCLHSAGIANRVTIYQPANRLTLFHFIEFGLFTLLAVAAFIALLALTRPRHR